MCSCAGLLKWVRDAIGDLARFHPRHSVEFFLDQAALDAGPLTARSLPDALDLDEVFTWVGLL
jgi:hypothetical protein